MNRINQILLTALTVMAFLFGGSLTANAATVTENLNSGLPEGWSLVGNINNDSDRARTGKGVWSNGKSATDNYLATSPIEGTLTFYWRSFGTSGSYPNGTVYVYQYDGTSIGTLIQQTAAYKGSTWKQETIDLGSYHGQVAIALYSACIDDITYMPYAAAEEAKLEVNGYASGSTFDFGTVPEGATKTFTLNNTGLADLSISSISVTGGFTITEGATLTSIAAQASAQLTIATPAADAEGLLTVESNDANSPYTISLKSTFKVPAPQMGINMTSVNFGRVTENASAEVTVSNTGDAELVADIASDNSEFTVSPASLTVAAGAQQTFTVTFIYDETAYGAHAATITVTPNAGNPVSISASASIKNPNTWTEDFETNSLPKGWEADALWTFGDGVAHGAYQYATTSYLTTPALMVDGPSDQLTFQGREAGIYPSIKIEKSLNGGAWTTCMTINSDNISDQWQTYTVTGLEAGTYRFRFVSDSYDLDNFEGFVLNANAPAMDFKAEDFVAGKVTTAASKTYTVNNSGTGTLMVDITSDNEMFTVTPAQLTVTDQPQQFTVTFTPQEGVFGKFDATITVTPAYDAAQAVSFKATAQVVDPEAWAEYFDEEALPEGWDVIGTLSNWTFANGMASGSYEPNGWLVTPKLIVEANKELTFQAKSKQYNTDIKVQYQKDGGEWTDLFSEERNSQDEFETFTISQLEAGTYRFRIATENIYLDNFEGFRLVPSEAVRETWYVSYTFHYMGANNTEQKESAVEEMEVEFDGDDLAFNFPNPIRSNTWMKGTKSTEEGPVSYIFPNGQYIGKFGTEDAYYCGSNGNELIDMQFYYDEEANTFHNFQHILINSSQTVVSYWGYFSDVVISKTKPDITGIARQHERSTTTANTVFDLQGRQVTRPSKGIYIVGGRKVIIR
jgi:hypothetical protein